MNLTREQRVKRREILLALYTLERKFGVSADLYHVVQTEPDLETGDTGITPVKYHIPKLITCTGVIGMDFSLGLRRIHALSSLGEYDPNDRVAILRNTFGIDDLGSNDYIVYLGDRYLIKDQTNLDYRLGWLLKLRQTPGTQPYQLHDRAVWSRVTPSQEISNG